MRKFFHISAITISLALLASCGGGVKLTTGYDVQLGTGDHFTLTRDYGGLYSDSKMQLILENVLPRLTRIEGWTGEVYQAVMLDSQDIDVQLVEDTNFYITRGLLALLNSEAELAAALLIEVRHNLLLHQAQPRLQNLSPVLNAKILEAKRDVEAGINLGELTEKQEVWGFVEQEEAAVDALAMSDMQTMGYNPSAYLAVLEKIYAHAELQMLLTNDESGGEAQIWRARHPISEERLRKLRRDYADLATTASTATYLSAVENMPYGARVDKRFLRGGLYVNQTGKYSFRVPTDFYLTILPSGAFGIGPDGASFVFDTPANKSGVALGEYITGRWGAEWEPSKLTTRSVSSRPAAQAQAIRDDRQLRLAAIAGLKNRLYRFKFNSPEESWTSNDRDFQRVIRSFRLLNPHELEALDPLQIYIFTVRPGDTVISLARRMAVTRAHEQHFRALNGLGERAQLKVGQRVKLVR